MGRPTDFTPELADLICARLAEGDTLSAVCRDDDMPHRATVYRWLEAREEFRDRYARACEFRADAWADELLDIADDISRDTIQTENGERPNTEWIQRAKLRVDTRKWLMAKAAPKKYGERLDVDANLKHGLGSGMQELLDLINERGRPRPAGAS